MTRVFALLSMLSLQAACGQLEADRNKAPGLINRMAPSAAEAMTGAVQSEAQGFAAKLAGLPAEESSEVQIRITVSEVEDYQWKLGAEASTDCLKPEGYSEFQDINTPLLTDLTALRGSKLVVKLCVLGQKSGGLIQAEPTVGRWTWTPLIPAAYEQFDLLDGDNQVTLKPRLLSGQWLVIRSPLAFDGKPEHGVLYSLDQRFGNGTVVAVGNVTEWIDRQVKNQENWTYTVFAMNAARRYSSPSSKSLRLAEQTLSWVRRDDWKPGMNPIYPLANNLRGVCRARHFDPNTGMNLGVHPGRSSLLNGTDLKNTQCLYEFARVIYAVSDFEILVANKGDPMNKLRWERASAGTNGSFIPPGALLAGRDEYDASPGQDMYICRAYTNTNRTILESFGKVGPNLAGCRSALLNDASQTTERPAMDILVLK